MNVPKHIGIILDGNRRFAKRLMVKPWKGHEWGAQKFRDFTEWCFELGIEEITAYVLSIQNFNRPKEELDYIINILTQEIKHLLTEEKLAELKEQGIRINFVGRQQMLPEHVQELQNKLMKATKDNKSRRINFAMAYGGREEIIDAVKKIAVQAKEGTLDPAQINEETIEHALWLESEPELIIRTGGERRTSNFLPWQGTYSELMFVDKYWPEIEEADLLACVKNFSERDRRFGK